MNTLKIKKIYRLLVLFFLVSCKPSANTSSVDANTTELPKPPLFYIENAKCHFVIPISPTTLYHAHIMFDIYAENLTTTLRCHAWGAADITFSPCIQQGSDPLLLTSTAPSASGAEIACVSNNTDYSNDHITMFVICIDSATGLSTIKSLRTTSCVPF